MKKKQIKESASGSIKIKIGSKNINFLVTVNIDARYLYIKFIARTSADLDLIKTINNKKLIIEKLKEICNISLFGRKVNEVDINSDAMYKFSTPIYLIEDLIISNILDSL